jgi:tetratricopeptide (TPR) repeat protein
MRRALVLLTALSSVSFAQDHDHPADAGAAVGRVSFPVSCSADVQPRFEQAVAMLHSFWFEAANGEFTQIARADSTCALAYWGQAMTLMGNPMTRMPPNAQRLQQGLALAQRSVALASRASHREQMYADAVLAYYRDHGSRDHMARMKTHEQAFDALRRAHPDDMEATIFFARTVVANASPTDKTYADQLRAAELMLPLFDRHPKHPGLAHYIIHAYDAPAIAPRGEAAARAYAGIAPDAPHALHMPSHIFTRIGRWDESIETNARSARAEPDSNAAVHPMDYMVYAYLQQGRVREAKAVVDRAVTTLDQFYGRSLGYNYRAMRARFALEQHAWRDAAALQPGAQESENVRALTHFARALGAARGGNPRAARADIDSLAKLEQSLRASNDEYWATVVGAQHQAAAAWAMLPSDRERALAMARAAADLEETVEKHPVTPGPLLPARELLADMLLESGRARDAQAEYEKTLINEPRRLRSLHGAARAAEQAGDRAGARRHYAALLEVAAKADADRPEVAAARAFTGS